MSFISFSEWMDTSNALSVPHQGVVLSNDDPMKRGRIKVKVPKVLESDDIDRLPWVYPRSLSFLGANGLSNFMAIPEVGSYVEIEFPYDNPYFPFYSFTWSTSEGKDFELFATDNYPNVYGFKDSVGNSFIVDKTALTIKVSHATGTSTTYNKDGSMDINTVDDTNIISEKKVSIVAKEDVVVEGKNVSVTASESASVDSKDVKVTSDTASINSKSVEIEGTSDVKISSSGSVSITGSSVSLG